MKTETIEITKLEKTILDFIVNRMTTEYGYSDLDINEIPESGIKMNVARGVLGSLTKKRLIDAPDPDFKDTIFLSYKTEGLVKYWLEQGADKPVNLIVVN
mgnify:CR=1 FL=1